VKARTVVFGLFACATAYTSEQVFCKFNDPSVSIDHTAALLPLFVVTAFLEDDFGPSLACIERLPSAVTHIFQTITFCTAHILAIAYPRLLS